MRFKQFKKFRKFLPGAQAIDIFEYLTEELNKFFQELQIGLSRLRFTDNFDSFETTVTIPATTEIEIRNELRNKQIPTQRLFVRGGTGSQDIVDGDTEWSVNYVYLKNPTGSPVTVTVIFLR